MASFGEQLRQARETQNITLQEIAASTKISSRALQALESEHFDQLPGGIFNKGFVRAYARYVGLDEEKMLAAYLAAAKTDGSSETDMQAMSSQITAAQAGRRDSGVNGTALIGIVALLVALGLGGVWLREHRREVREQAAEAATTTSTTAPAESKSPAPSPEPSPIAPAESTPAPATPATAGAPAIATPAATPAAPPAASQGSSQSAGPVEVSISATKQAWISVRSDGKLVDSLLLDPDVPSRSSRSYKAKEKLKIVLGNAGGVSVVYNGKPAGALGREGQTETVTFTAAGMEKH